jgi:hypothetical protein
LCYPSLIGKSWILSANLRHKIPELAMQTATTSQTMTKSATTSQELTQTSHPQPGGLDVGNGSVKLALDIREIRCPSYILPIHGEIYDPPSSDEGGLVFYVEGDRKDLIGTRFLAGYPAYQANPEAYFRVVDDPQGKVTYGLHGLLGAIATMPYQPEMTFNLVASVHLQKAFGEQLQQALQGTHKVEFNACGKKTLVKVNILKTLEEGSGAIAHCRAEIDPDKQTLLFDLGNGTCIISVFGSKGRLVDRVVRPGGVENLIEAIAKNLDMVRHLSQEGDRQIIRAGIEDGTFRYGETGWAFESIYRAELVPWVASTIKSAVKAGAKWRPTCSHHIAIGGGSQLPLVGELLTQQGIKPIKEGEWANARGLRRIAVLLGGGR